MLAIRHAWRAIGLCFVAALASLAFSAPAAQATGEFKIAGSSLGGQESIRASLPAGGIDISVQNLAITYHCQVFELSKGTIEKGGAFNEAFTFSQCVALGAEEQCTVHPIEGSAKGHLVLHEGVTYFIFEATSGNYLMNVKVLGAECSLPEEYPFEGSFAAAIQGKEAVKQQITSVNEATSKLLGVQLEYGAEPVTIEGGLILELIGANAGKVWGAV